MDILGAKNKCYDCPDRNAISHIIGNCMIRIYDAVSKEQPRPTDCEGRYANVRHIGTMISGASEGDKRIVRTLSGWFAACANTENGPLPDATVKPSVDTIDYMREHNLSSFSTVVEEEVLQRSTIFGHRAPTDISEAEAS